MRWLIGVTLMVAVIGACGGEDVIPEELLLSIPVTGGELNAVRGADLCEAPEPTAGPVVLFLHGAAFNANTWVETGTHRLLCEAGLPSLSVDLPGFGRSARFDHDPVALMDQLVTYIGADVILVSPSMSGGYSLPWLMTNPAGAAGFVPVAPVGIGSWSTPAGFAVPTMGLWGGDDSIVPVSQGERLIAAIPEARLVVIPDGGHAVYMTNPDEFHTEFLAFVQSLR